MPVFTEFQGDIDLFKMGVVFDAESKAVPISRFWDKHKAILVFLRHFGCLACRAHAEDVWKRRDDLQKGRGRIVFIGNGSPEYIKTFKEDFGLDDAPVFTDPTLRTFQNAGLLRGFKQLISLDSLRNMRKLAGQGHPNENPFTKGIGSHLQMGGLVIVDSNGTVPYHYISDALGDDPDPEDFTEYAF